MPSRYIAAAIVRRVAPERIAGLSAPTASRQVGDDDDVAEVERAAKAEADLVGDADQQQVAEEQVRLLEMAQVRQPDQDVEVQEERPRSSRPVRPYQRRSTSQLSAAIADVEGEDEQQLRLPERRAEAHVLQDRDGAEDREAAGADRRQLDGVDAMRVRGASLFEQTGVEREARVAVDRRWQRLHRGDPQGHCSSDPCSVQTPRLPHRLGPTRFRREPSLAQQPPGSHDVTAYGRSGAGAAGGVRGERVGGDRAAAAGASGATTIGGWIEPPGRRRRVGAAGEAAPAPRARAPPAARRSAPARPQAPAALALRRRVGRRFPASCSAARALRQSGACSGSSRRGVAARARCSSRALAALAAQAPAAASARPGAQWRRAASRLRRRLAQRLRLRLAGVEGGAAGARSRPAPRRATLQ